MISCPTCKDTMNVSHLHCERCSLNLQGQFMLPRLARMPKEHQKLAEAFLLAGGNFKVLAEQLGISYPTLRRRVDDVMASLRGLLSEDRKKGDEILTRIEQGSMSAQEGLRLIREMNNED